MTLRYTYVDSPVGVLLLTGDDAALTGIAFDPPPDAAGLPPDAVEDAPRFAAVTEQLEAYFDGRLRRFDVPLTPRGTAFQEQVWAELAKIPYGATVSYGELAERIGQPGAARPVGMANGRNPIPIILPCHRVIGADGTLTGYGGGLDRKRLLLDLEAGQARL